MSVYCASKFAVVGLSESMQQDLADTNVNVSVLCPGFVRTNIFESERNRPDELKNTQPRQPRPERAAMVDALKAGAQPVEHAAECVLDAIRGERFWIFTHPEVAEAARQRAQHMFEAFDAGPQLQG